MKRFLAFTLWVVSFNVLPAAERVALVVGCANYPVDSRMSLDTPLNDMNDLAAALETPALGFQVIRVADATRESFDAGLAKFKAAAAGAKIAMVYFSGHGIEHDDQNYLVTVNATLDDEFQLPSQTMPLENVMKVLGGTGAAAKLAVLDCCRNNPFSEKPWMKTKDFVRDHVLRELGEAEIPRATLVCFATGAGRKAAAVISAASVRSPFTDELIKEITIPGLPLRTVFENVHDRVKAATKGRQVPAVKTDNALSEIFRLTVLIPGRPAVLGGLVEDDVWDQEKTGDVAEAQLPGKVGVKFVRCAAGTFTMGSPKGEEERSDDEDQVEVTLTKGFWLGRTEVTQAQWQAVMGYNPSNSKGGNLPVEKVSWDDAQRFIQRLNDERILPKGWRFSLPTEAQWEYACRAGTKTTFHCGEDLAGVNANFDVSIPYNGTRSLTRTVGQTTDVGSYKPNAWGLCDMHGNVWELCLDSWDAVSSISGGEDPVGDLGVYRVARGGSWKFYAKNCRSAMRNWFTVVSRDDALGFRLAVIRTKP